MEVGTNVASKIISGPHIILNTTMVEKNILNFTYLENV